MNYEKFLSVTRFCGLVTLLVYWIFTLLSISKNPWFSVMHNALSDLGSPEAREPWLYNYGLIISSPILFLFSLHLIDIAKNRIQVVGGAFITIASLFLSFIGIFHSGTAPHGFVSSYFFLQFFLGMEIFGCATSKKWSIFTTMLFLSALFGAFLHWPSTATLEIYEIGIITILVTAIAIFNPEKSENTVRSH